MILDNDILASIGINVSPEKAEELIKHFEETLQERVGLEIFDALDDDQAKELIALQQGGNQEAISVYIKEHIPDYEQIVQDEADILLGELSDNADNIAEAA